MFPPLYAVTIQLHYENFLSTELNNCVNELIPNFWKTKLRCIKVARTKERGYNEETGLVVGP